MSLTWWHHSAAAAAAFSDPGRLTVVGIKAYNSYSFLPALHDRFADDHIQGFQHIILSLIK